jgi:Domain of unknown function (DUF397)
MLSSAWSKASQSNPSGNCVEVRMIDGGAGEVAIQVRDSKFPEAGILTFTPAEWDAFIGGVHDGQFDA